MYSMAMASTSVVPSSAPAAPSAMPTREPRYARGRETKTLPTCSISWEVAVGTMFCCPCMKPRKAASTHTMATQGAMTRKPISLSGWLTRWASIPLPARITMVHRHPSPVSSQSATRNTRLALRGSSLARQWLTMREMATGRPAEDTVSRRL